MIVELRDRMADMSATCGDRSVPGANGASPDSIREATLALQQLGYKLAEINRMVQQVAVDGDGSEAIIRKVLRTALGG